MTINLRFRRISSEMPLRFPWSQVKFSSVNSREQSSISPVWSNWESLMWGLYEEVFRMVLLHYRQPPRYTYVAAPLFEEAKSLESTSNLFTNSSFFSPSLELVFEGAYESSTCNVWNRCHILSSRDPQESWLHARWDSWLVRRKETMVLTSSWANWMVPVSWETSVTITNTRTLKGLRRAWTTYYLKLV